MIVLYLFVFFVFGHYVHCNLTSYVEINETEYIRMPPLFHLDEYEPCIHQPGGVYCSASFDIVSEEPNELYNFIQEYSSYTKIHYNHSQLYRGICLTKTCKDFYNKTTTLDQKYALEACLNDTFHKRYGFHTKLTESVNCHTLDEPMVLDAVDIAVATVVGLIIVFNLIGSLHKFWYEPTKATLGNRFWDCFSIQRNLKRLSSPTKADAYQDSINCFYGLRTLNMILVIFYHSMLSFDIAVDNPHYYETIFKNYLYQMIFNGTLMVQTFFVMSGFLLVYNLLLTEEKAKVQWTMVPKGIFIRWLRLLPPYAFMLALTATWLRFAGSGPLWQIAVGDPVEDCRRYWHYHMLFVHNYVDHSLCMPQTWYIAADLQLHILGLIVCALIPRAGRNIAIGLLFIIGLITPAVTTYMLDLEGVLIESPEAIRHLFANDVGFNAVYKRGHTNIAGFALGLALGTAVYHWQQTDFNFHHYIKSRFVYWAMFPAMAAICMCGTIFYSSSPYPLLFRAAYAALVKPIFAAIVSIIIIGIVFKYEKPYRAILEWQGWQVLARLAYSTYCVHFFVIQGLAGSRTNLVHSSFALVTETGVATIFLSFELAIPLWLFVEAPAGKLIRLALNCTGRRPADKVQQTDSENVPVDAVKSEMGTIIDVNAIRR